MPDHNTSQIPSNVSTSSIRRNLFSNQLSQRRPDPSASNHPSDPLPYSRANPSTHSLNNLANAPAFTSSPYRRPVTSRTQSSDPFDHSNASTITTTDITNANNNGDIVVRDHLGRPSLPDIPILLPHLRLSSNTASLPQADRHHSHGADEAGVGVADLGELELESAMQEKEDQDRIEKSLVDMMYRSRVRGNGGSGGGGGGGGAAGGNGGLGAEGEELLALVQASLRKKVASLEEDRWMFEGEGARDDYGAGNGFR